MATRRVRCPECMVILDIPKEFRGTRVLCTACGAKFSVPEISDDQILHWIGPESKEDTVHAVPALSGASETEGANHTHPASELDRGPLFGGVEGFHLERIDNRGALFSFPAALLENPSFRVTMPRRCLRCGATSHISVRLVIFGPNMADCATAEPDFLDSSFRLSDQEARNLPMEEILSRLPNLSRLPTPANLPMPYWICDLCSPSKMVYAQNEIPFETGQGRCRLQIQRLWRAEEFLVNVGGADSQAHRELLAAIQSHPETSWDMLSGVVQQRLRQWYAPNRGERFIAYAPDRSHTRTEDGMAGVVVSTRRLIYHTSLRHRESEKGESVELIFAMDGGRLTLKIRTPNWEVKNMVMDKAGLERLRRALSQEQFNAVWH
jgi:hypothetical protein